MRHPFSSKHVPGSAYLFGGIPVPGFLLQDFSPGFLLQDFSSRHPPPGLLLQDSSVVRPTGFLLQNSSCRIHPPGFLRQDSFSRIPSSGFFLQDFSPGIYRPGFPPPLKSCSGFPAGVILILLAQFEMPQGLLADLFGNQMYRPRRIWRLFQVAWEPCGLDWNL